MCKRFDEVGENMVFHGIMFHHFHGENHPPGQGSVTADEFHQMISLLRKEYRFLSAIDFLEAAHTGRLRSNDVCLTLDDSLLCQYEIAKPVLADHGLTAFYFVYSSAFTNSPDMLEVYRFFRSTEFTDFDQFCHEFMLTANLRFGAAIESGLENFDADKYLTDYPFYSRNDKLFRFVRDQILGPAKYFDVMSVLMEEKAFKVEEVLPRLYMDRVHLEQLKDEGNVIGLHSHTHPTRMDALRVEDQRMEYELNYSFLAGVGGPSGNSVPISMSHPCGKYNAATLQILADLGIRLGFRNSMKKLDAPSLLEIPRENHSNIRKRFSSGG